MNSYGLTYDCRCITYMNLQRYDEALIDAVRVVIMNPNWPKVCILHTEFPVNFVLSIGLLQERFSAHEAQGVPRCIRCILTSISFLFISLLSYRSSLHDRGCSWIPRVNL